MDIINALLKRVVEFNNGLTSGEYFKEAVEENEAFIVELNSEEQLFEKGITSTGVSIADYAPYSPVTVEIKQQKGQPVNRVTLRDEGDFHASFAIVADNEQFEIVANDWKVKDLTLYYGDEILGLTDDNIRVAAREFVYPELMEKARKIILND